MIILKFLLLCVVLFIVPELIGLMINSFTNNKYDYILNYVVGMVTLFAVFQLIAVPCIIAKTQFRVVVIAWFAVIAILCIVSLVRLVSSREEYRQDIKTKISNISLSAPKIVALLLMAAMIIFQCCMYVFYQHTDADDSRYVVNALETYNSNTMFLNNPITGQAGTEFVGELVKDVTSPWVLFITLIAKMILIHPTIVAHTILPPILLVLAYAVYWLLARKLFRKDTVLCAMFVSLASVINIFGNSSVYTGETFLLTRVWQGKAVYCGIMIPVLLLFLLNIYTYKRINANYIVLGIASIAGCLMSGIGIELTAIMIGVFGFWNAIEKKSFKAILPVIVACMPCVFYGILYYLFSR